jgi:GT2 family glycosyltransferase
VLDEFGRERKEREHLRHGHAHPALTRLQERARPLVEIEDEIQFGAPPSQPDVSVVVPLYQRIDLLEHQLVQFGRDPQLAQADLVYVLDSPELASELRPLAAELYAFHEAPFRVVVLARNAGYSAANNVGVSQARGRLVVLMNSDVMPASPGWLERMAAFHDSTPQIGALGPKLLYEDLSIQHAGMYFRRETQTALWGNMHYFKGLHRDLAEAGVSRPVPAVTGACLMVDRELYGEVGGLSDLFVQGGYEDSDFCLKLAERDLRNWYLADVELYHLEAQSFASPLRTLATSYNTWLQTQVWGEAIERLMQSQELAEHDLFAGDRLTIPSQLSSVG